MSTTDYCKECGALVRHDQDYCKDCQDVLNLYVDEDEWDEDDYWSEDLTKTEDNSD